MSFDREWGIEMALGKKSYVCKIQRRQRKKKEKGEEKYVRNSQKTDMSMKVICPKAKP